MAVSIKTLATSKNIVKISNVNSKNSVVNRREVAPEIKLGD
jgi:hypothetical protein